MNTEQDTTITGIIFKLMPPQEAAPVIRAVQQLLTELQTEYPECIILSRLPITLETFKIEITGKKEKISGILDKIGNSAKDYLQQNVVLMFNENGVPYNRSYFFKPESEIKEAKGENGKNHESRFMR